MGLVGYDLFHVRASEFPGDAQVHLIEQKFMPFGEALHSQVAPNLPAKGFTNHEQTDPSGLIYMQARFYAPWFVKTTNGTRGNSFASRSCVLVTAFT